MKTKIISIAIFIFLALSFNACKKPEPPSTGTISGKITDAKSGLAIVGASVQLDKDNRKTSTVTDGSFSFTDLQPASYTITVTKSGFVVNPQTATVVAGQVTPADFQMETPTILLYPSVYSAQATAGTTNLTVTSNTAWATVSSEPSWLTCTQSGSGNGVIAVNYAVNNSTTSRTGSITLTATGLTPQIFSFTQAGQTPNLSIYPSVQNVLSTAGSSVFTVTANTNWAISSDQPWCTLSPANGNGNGTFTANYTINSGNTSRTATITITSAGLPNQTISLTQAQFVASLSVSPPNQSVSSLAGSSSFSVASNITWTATSDQTWCTLVNASGNGNGTITLNYSANTTAGNRVANITVSGNGVTNQIVSVSQANFVGTLSIAPSNQNVNPTAGNTSFTITANTSWTATSNQTWCTLANTNGTGNGTLTANFTANTTLGNRTATITVVGNGIANQTITVSQSYTIPSLTASPGNQSVVATAGSTSFAVTSNISWAASSDQSWCTLANASGTGNGTLTVNYAANTTSSQRVANITLSGAGVTSQTVSVTQASAIPTSGLVAYYPFNGNANDESGNGNNGTINGATLTTDRKGVANKAYKFNDGNSIRVSNSTSLHFSNQISFSVWINLSSYTGRDGYGNLNTYGYQNIFSKNCDGQWIWSGIAYNSIEKKMLAQFSNNASGIDVFLPSFAINTWYNLSFTFDGNIAKCYFNGVKVSEKVTTFNFTAANNVDLFIGNSGCWNYFFNGNLDDFRFYNRALSDAEIQSLYNE